MAIIKHIFCAVLLLLVISDLSTANVRLCGKTLTQFLEVVCVDGFNPKNLKAKKSDPTIDFNENAAENDNHPLAFASLFMDENNVDVNSLMAKTRRRRFDGVADECCRKPCALSELMSYCL